MLMKYFKIPQGSIKSKRCGPHIVFKWSILVLKQQYTTLPCRFTILIALSNPILHLIDHSGCFESSVHVTAAIFLLPHHPSPELLSVFAATVPEYSQGKIWEVQNKAGNAPSPPPRLCASTLHTCPGEIPGSWDVQLLWPFPHLPQRKSQSWVILVFHVQETQVPIYFSKCYRLCLSVTKSGIYDKYKSQPLTEKAKSTQQCILVLIASEGKRTFLAIIKATFHQLNREAKGTILKSPQQISDGPKRAKLCLLQT